jgi:aspartyl-tRNA(Asn)/glutamyl-tRNA(Gln) amidotransferase subunit A
MAMADGEPTVDEAMVEQLARLAQLEYNALPPLVGLPALSVPCGFSDDGLPVGMQLIGRAFEESTLFRIGHGYQRLTTWHLKAPSL